MLKKFRPPLLQKQGNTVNRFDGADTDEALPAIKKRKVCEAEPIKVNSVNIGFVRPKAVNSTSKAPSVFKTPGGLEKSLTEHEGIECYYNVLW